MEAESIRAVASKAGDQEQKHYEGLLRGYEMAGVALADSGQALAQLHHAAVQKATDVEGRRRNADLEAETKRLHELNGQWKHQKEVCRVICGLDGEGGP